MLYTRKGDNGTTKTFGCDQRISKSSNIAEALGTLDEINSFLGVCKVKGASAGFKVPTGENFEKVVHAVQQNLFIVQAELAGSDMTIGEEKVKEIENYVDTIEKELPPITSFFISGGTELAAFFDVARTISRRAERRVIGVADEGQVKVGDYTKAYLNRLSSLLYALARLSNHFSGIKEEPPTYK
jgi:cob(I)alamin adenosyltransferase